MSSTQEMTDVYDLLVTNRFFPLQKCHKYVAAAMPDRNA